MGIVGPTGAGKTTLLKMLSMETTMSFDAQALILNDTTKKIDFIEKG